MVRAGSLKMLAAMSVVMMLDLITNSLAAPAQLDSKAKDVPRFHLPKQVAILRTEDATSTSYDFAVSELKRLLGRIGVEASSASEKPSDGVWRVRVLVRVDAPREPTSEVGELKADGFVSKVSKNGITIVSKTPKGILNGVYDLAERLGYLFLYPGEAGEWPPIHDGHELSLPMGTATANPRFPYRGIFNGSSSEEWAVFYAKMRFNALCQATDRALAEKLGLRIEQGGHQLDMLLPPELFKERPEIFRMDQPEDFFGNRVGDFNYCVTSPEAKRIVKENYRTKIKSLSDQGIYAWHTWPEDLPAGGWCYCTTCRSFGPSDQSMLAMRMLADVIREEKIPMRVPMLAYHDTMFPGKKIDAAKEVFLLFAPRKRCYGHSLVDPSCAVNEHYLLALKAWKEKLEGITDAHTFEYYLDRVLFRGFYPFLPQVILDDMDVYQQHGIESHICLQTGTAFVPRLMMLNLPVFARGMWEDGLDAENFIAEIAKKILPDHPKPWVDYLTRRVNVYTRVMRWEDESPGWADYRFISETTLPSGRETVQVCSDGSVEFTKLAKDLEGVVSPGWPNRVRALAKSEIRRTRFEAAEMKVMMYQQDAVNRLGQYLNTGSLEELKRGVDLMAKTIEELKTSRHRAEEAGIKKGDYYYMFNDWMTREMKAKIEKWRHVVQ